MYRFNIFSYSLSAIAPSPSTQSLTLTSTILVGGSGKDTYGMPTTSFIANTNSDIFETAIPTATTITPKSTIVKGEPIKQSQWLYIRLFYFSDMEQCTKTITVTTMVTSIYSCQ